MTAEGGSAHPQATRRGLAAAWRRNGLVLLALLLLQALSIGLAYAPLGRWVLGVNVGIAALQALVVGTFSMGLEKTTALNRLTAAAGFVFVLVMFSLTLGDVYTRL